MVAGMLLMAVGFLSLAWVIEDLGWSAYTQEDLARTGKESLRVNAPGT
jgi:hypothetical protein